MKMKISWHINNWTPINGPGTIVVWCKVSKEGFEGRDERPGQGDTSGKSVLYNTFDRFMEIIDLARDAVRKIKNDKKTREKVLVEGLFFYPTDESVPNYLRGNLKKSYLFYEYGSTSPRNPFMEINEPRSSVLAKMIIDYIEDNDPPPIGMIRDYILDHVQPIGEC